MSRLPQFSEAPTKDRILLYLQKAGALVWQFIGTSITLVFGVYVGLYAKKIDISDTGHFSKEAKWFLAVFLISVLVQVFKDRGKDRQLKGKFSNNDFLNLYTEALSKAIAVLPECRQATLEELQEALQATLSLISDVVASYHRKDGLNINANVMLAYAPDTINAAEFHSKVRFTYPKLPQSAYTHVLRIVAWAKGHTHDEFNLAVHSDPNQILFGAPKVFATGEIEYQKDTRKIKANSPLIAHQAKTVKDQIVSYFRTTDFRSFVSMRIECGKIDPAVLSIESSQCNVFGLTQDQEEEMKKYITPFSEVLSFIIQEFAVASNQS